jgi:DNA-directed RNA polymerase specialized sigma24 family protein
MASGSDDDAAAFDAFVQSRSPRLLRTAHLLTGDRAVAEKALTTALAETWRTWSGGGDRAEDVALRHLVAAGKRATAGGESSTRLPEGLGTGDTTRVAARGSLRRQLATMPAELRAVVVLRHADGLSQERVASVLGEDVAQVQRAEDAALVLLARDEDLAPYVLEPGA